MKVSETLLTEILKSETGISVGCTKVAAVALSAAWARKALGEDPERMEITLDRGTYKNGMGVGIPGTREIGIPWAAVIGACIGKPEEDLKILGNISSVVRDKAKRLLLNNKINVTVNRMAQEIYIHCKLKGSSSTAESLITQKHDHVKKVLLDGKIYKGWKEFQKPSFIKVKKKLEIKDIPFEAFIPFVESVPLKKLTFLKKGLEVNRNFAMDCLNHLDEMELSPILERWSTEYKETSVRPDEYGKLITTAAVEARMRGFPKPVFTCGGSGNQGLVASLPLIGYAEKVAVPSNLFLRSVALSFLVTIYIKAYTGILSPICGCGIGSAIGVGCGLAYLLGGKQKEIDGVIKNMVGTTAGIICDGAKSGCAFKALLMVGMAFDSAKLAIEGVIIASRNGILSQSIEETLANLEHLTHFGMAHADDAILDVMTKEESFFR
jgi:L-cysteine desulfidase